MSRRPGAAGRDGDALDHFCRGESQSGWFRGVTRLSRIYALTRARTVLALTVVNWTLRVVKPGMLVLAAVVFYAFSQLTAAQEVFAASAEKVAQAKGLFSKSLIVAPTVAVLLLLSTLLFLSQQQFSRMRSSQYADSIPRRFIERAAPVAWVVAIITTASPWVAAAFGYWSAEAEFTTVKLSVGAIAENFGGGAAAETAAQIRSAAPDAVDFERQAANLKWLMLVIGLLIIALFNSAALFLTPRQRSVRFRFWRVSGLRVAAAFFLAIAIAPLIAPQWVLGPVIEGGVDPVAVGATAIFFTIGFFIGIGMIAYRLGVPSFAVFAVVVGLALIAQFFAGAAPPRDLAAMTEEAGDAAPAAQDARAPADASRCDWLRREPPSVGPEREARDPRSALETRLHAWLCARADQDPSFAGGAEGPRAAEPVFVLAARGGGAYAAIATTTLLARLDASMAAGGAGAPDLNAAALGDCAAEPARRPDALPFSDRLFAVVGVSGGAVGAAVNRALIKDRAPLCALEGAARRVLTAGHISAVFSVLGGDIARKFVFWSGAASSGRYDRAGALEESLETAYARELAALRGGARSQLQTPGGGRICDHDTTLCRPFAQLAADPGKAALVLNTTSSTLGYRVAFSPMALGDIGDGTLISFGEFDPPLAAAELEAVSLIRAAVASARFPGITPAFTVGKEGAERDRFNFVDGGFADSTGATTALEIFERLQALSETYPIEPHLIVIADQAQRGEGPPREQGSPFADVGATADAVLNIRSLLSRRALRRVTTYFTRENLRDRLHVIEFERQSFNLPLGWRLSETMATMLALQIGWPDFADAFRRDRDAAPLHPMSDVILNNSCELARIRRAVSGAGAASLPPNCACAGVEGLCAPE